MRGVRREREREGTVPPHIHTSYWFSLHVVCGALFTPSRMCGQMWVWMGLG